MAFIIRKSDNLVREGDPKFVLAQMRAQPADVDVFSKGYEAVWAQIKALIGSGTITNPQTPVRHWAVTWNADPALSSVVVKDQAGKDAADIVQADKLALRKAQVTRLRMIQAKTNALIVTKTLAEADALQVTEQTLMASVATATTVAEVEAVSDART